MPTASILKDVIMTPFREPTLSGNAYISTQREREKKLPRNDGKMCPSLQLRTIILCKKIVSIAFQPRSKMALMGVKV